MGWRYLPVRRRPSNRYSGGKIYHDAVMGQEKTIAL
jgi:hypothetical protein